MVKQEKGSSVKKESGVKQESVVKKESVVKVKQEKESGTKGGKKGTPTGIKVKKENDTDEGKAEDVEEDEEYRWWENYDQLNEDKTIKWTTLEHSGVYFPPEYEPHGVKLIYDGQELDLEPEAEEVASFYAAMIESDYTSMETFNTNFFNDFRKVLRESKSKHVNDDTHLYAHSQSIIFSFVSFYREMSSRSLPSVTLVSWLITLASKGPRKRP